MNKFEKLKQVLGLDADPVGVKLIYDYNNNLQEDSRFESLNGIIGYCEYVKRASEGEYLKIQKEDFNCHTGNIMLGFEDSTSLELTMKLESKGLRYILLFPINKTILDDYDSIILVLNPVKCMKIIQAYVRAFKKPLKITCGAINGVCSEVTAYVIKRNEVNFSFLCPNSRINGTFSDCDLLCGIPNILVNDLLETIVNS
jgi:uncharacterized protein (DUF169 family)